MKLWVQSLENRNLLSSCRFQPLLCQLDELGYSFATKFQFSVLTKTDEIVANNCYLTPAICLPGEMLLWIGLLSAQVHAANFRVTWSCGHSMSCPPKFCQTDVCLRFLVMCWFPYKTTVKYVRKVVSILPPYPPLFEKRITSPPQNLLLTFNSTKLTYNLLEGHRGGEPDNRRTTPNAATLLPLSCLGLFSSQLNANELRCSLFTSPLISSILTLNCIFEQSSLSLFLFYFNAASFVWTQSAILHQFVWPCHLAQAMLRLRLNFQAIPIKTS